MQILKVITLKDNQLIDIKKNRFNPELHQIPNGESNEQPKSTKSRKKSTPKES
jgi:hypothetical protein